PCEPYRKAPARTPDPAASVESTEQPDALRQRGDRPGRGDQRQSEEPVTDLGLVVPGRRGGERAGGEQDVEDPVADPEGSPRPVHGGRQAVSRAVRPHPGEELRDASEDGGERREVQGGGGVVPVPARQVGRDHERRSREAEQPEDGRRSDRLEEDPRLESVAAWPVTPCLVLGDRAHGRPPSISISSYYES